MQRGENCISLFLLVVLVAAAVHCTACAPGTTGGLSLLLLPHEVYGDGDDNGYQYNANKDGGKVLGEKTQHGTHSFRRN